jgi:hypothetical protein
LVGFVLASRGPIGVGWICHGSGSFRGFDVGEECPVLERLSRDGRLVI